MKKIFSLILCAVILLSFAACGKKTPPDVTTDTPQNSSAAPDTTVSEPDEKETAAEMNIFVLSGPTGVGAVDLWSRSEAGTTQNTYQFKLVSANDEIIAAISKGEADIAAVATNLASTLYNKTEGQITVLAVNTLGVLSLMTYKTELSSLSDLKGKTIVSPGQGANPEYILRYVLTGNGIDPDKDVTLEFVADGSELPTVWAKNPDAVILAPQPVATSLLMKYTDARTVFDMTEEWNKLGGDSTLMMGCVIVRNAYLEEHPGAVETFLSEYKASIGAVKENPAAAGVLCETYGILPKAAIAEKAIPYCCLTFLRGAEMKTGLSGYLKVMYDANPKSVGGQLPGDDFYYNAE